MLIRSYLAWRKQFVKLAWYESTCKINDVGVPQGLVLGLLLFLILINDLENSTYLRVLSFADDTLLYKTLKTTHSQDSDNLSLEHQKDSICFR